MSKIICKCGNILPDITDNLFRESIPFFCPEENRKRNLLDYDGEEKAEYML
ncbi:MAG: hypothetical protein HFH92_05300 [Lachnospiraceae bacterium]|uniref:hypothetical protein n=1 Tax=uncultured Acetatifactor sp. TaxID=1671927 RepID=UPI00262A989B|nr:hypothetical protein [uncultured Acetatifactor sp.]MCI8788515.1 hypothetical protein [Lachnospiraceae bacterium]